MNNAQHNLTVFERYAALMVADSEGGIWFPSVEAEDDIAAAADPAQRALEIAQQEPQRGTWKQ